MKFLKITQDSTIVRGKKNYNFIENELVTLKECKKLGIFPKEKSIVEVSKKNTYWFFGCRLEFKKGGNL